MRRVVTRPAATPVAETIDEDDEVEQVVTKPVSIPKIVKKKPATVATPSNTPTNPDREVGVVHTKAGPKALYETPAKKYYTLRPSGVKSYVTARIISGKLMVETDNP